MITQAASEPLDYVRRLNKLGEDLLRTHSELLGRKGIVRKQQLIRAIRVDLDKLTHALVETKLNRARSVMETFFGEKADSSDICAKLTDQRIYHVGFQIHEPIALVLAGIHHWIEHSKRALNVHMTVRESLHFPASQAFQKRVGAEAEIMRIWLEVDDRVLMLELFDIYRPADSMLKAANQLSHRNFHPLFGQNELKTGHPDRLARLFAEDEIWHYAFYVRTREDVDQLHRELQRMAQAHPEFALPYNVPVHNSFDGSFHTKVIRLGSAHAARLELEFVTDYTPVAVTCPR